MEGGDSEFANFTLPTLKAVLEARSQNVWQQAISCCSCYRMSQNVFFPWTRDLLVSQKTMQRHFFYPLSPVIFATATAVAFVLLRNSRFNFHCYTQREATPTQKSAQKWQLQPLATSFAKDYNLGHSLMQTSFTEPPISISRQGGSTQCFRGSKRLLPHSFLGLSYY